MLIFLYIILGILIFIYQFCFMFKPMFYRVETIGNICFSISLVLIIPIVICGKWIHILWCILFYIVCYAITLILATHVWKKVNYNFFGGTNDPEENPSFEQNLEYVNQVNADITDHINALEQINNMINTQQNMLDKAIRDLDGLEMRDIIKQLESGVISKEQADEVMNSIEKLEFIINTTPANIEMLENKKREILEQLEQ